MDQAQHFGGSADAGGLGTGEGFREGLDLTERECTWFQIVGSTRVLIPAAVFSLAQGSAQQTRDWYTSTDKGR
jgi:hypothetical protein